MPRASGCSIDAAECSSQRSRRRGKQTCPTEVTVAGTRMEGLPVVWSGGDSIYLGGDEAFAWLDKRLAVKTL